MELKKKSSNFRISNKKFFLTYANHVVKGDMFEFLEDISPIKQCIISHETGETGYTHTHVLVWFIETINTTDSRKFDIKVDTELQNDTVIHPNIEFVKNGWSRVEAYCRKQDGEPFEFGCSNTPAKMVWSCESLSDALLQLGDWRNPMSIKTYWDNKPQEEIKSKLDGCAFLPWQLNIWKEMNEILDDRKIIWIVDPVGHNGKSTFVKHVLIKFKKDCVAVNDIGGYKNFANLIMNARKNGWSGKFLLVDFPRSKVDHGCYDSLEAAKDGLMTNTKYVAEPVLLPDYMMIVVFSNWWPKVSEMTKDRWDIRLLVGGSLSSITLKDAEDNYLVENNLFVPIQKSNENPIDFMMEILK